MVYLAKQNATKTKGDVEIICSGFSSVNYPSNSLGVKFLTLNCCPSTSLGVRFLLHKYQNINIL